MITASLPFIAFLGALITLILPGSKANALRAVTVMATSLCLAAVLYLFVTWDFSQTGFHHVRAWDVFSEYGIWYQTGMDGVNLVFCLLLAVVSFAGAWVAIRTPSRLKEYLFYYLFLTGCMFAVFTVLNIFFLYVFYELTLIPVFALLGIAGVRCQKEGAAIRTALYMTAGAMLALFALLHLYDILGPAFLDLTQAQNLLTAKAALLTPETQKWLAALLILGFGVMTSLFPLHSWSPAFYSAAPASLAMIHAGVKIGPYLLLRIAVTYLPEGFQFWMPPLAGLAVAGILYGGFAALNQKSLRPLAAFSSISHMGTLFLAFAALSTVSLTSGMLLIFAHGIMTACFFALIGSLEERGQTDEIQAFGGLGKNMPFFTVCFLLTALAASGIPGFTNFPAELLVFISAWKSYPWAVAAAVLGVLLTAVYMTRAVHGLCFGNERFPSSEQQDIRFFAEKIPFFVLIFTLILFGIQPSYLLNILQPAIEAIL